MKVCRNYKKQVEEKIEKPIEEWEERSYERCKRRPWWHPLRWFCWIVTTLVRVIRIVIITVVKWVTYTVCEVVTFATNVVGFLVELLKGIPVLGALVNVIAQLIGIVLWLVWQIVFAVFYLLLLPAGLHKTRYMRVHLIIQRNEKGDPIIATSQVDAWIAETKRIFAAIDVTCFFEVTTMNDASPKENLDVRIATEEGKHWGDAVLDSMSPWMARFRRWCALWSFEGAGGRLTGVGGNLVCFVVRDIEVLKPAGSKSGFSWGPAEDFIVVANDASTSTLAHEIGHSCWLTHRQDSNNLMFAGARTNTLIDNDQRFNIRNSKWVSTF